MRLNSIFVLLTFVLPTSAMAMPWALPVSLDDQNSSVAFKVDSTWHVIHGTTQGISGRIWLEDPGDVSTLHAEVRIPVHQFETGNSSRDEKMREVMGADRFPSVEASFRGGVFSCNEPTIAAECPARLYGDISIRGVSREIALLGTVSNKEGKVEFTGTFSLRWKDFGVEDPSILIAKLDEVVDITVRANWKIGKDL